MRFQSPPNILNQAQIVVISQSASAATNFSVTNLYSDGMQVFFTVHSLPGSASTTAALKVRMVDPATGAMVSIGGCPARSTSGTTMLSVSPFMNSASSGGSPNIMAQVPLNMNFLVSLSTGATSKDVVFSIGVNFTIS